VHQAERSKKHLILLLDIEITKCRHGSEWRTAMSLENKNAIIYGAGGAVGGAVARAFAREGARVFLTGRDLSTIDALAKESRLPVAWPRRRRSTPSTRRPSEATSMPS
jgi:hypothetical protein